MIHVPRGPEPESLAGAESPGGKETRSAIDHYKDGTKEPFGRYKVYKSDPVKSALNLLFRNKCAYCEMAYGGAPLDVEHFRPKSEIDEVDPEAFHPVRGREPTAPGYYWLAATWSNLLPSCIDCNRPRRHHAEGEFQTMGKGNSFPLEPGSARSLDPESDPETIERRLLIDPCRDMPERHLEFGRKGTIRAKRTDHGPDPRGVASIEVYALQRELLVQSREATQTMLRNRIFDAKRAARDLDLEPANRRARGDFDRALEEIKRHFLAAERPFLGMCRQLVRESLVDTVRAPTTASIPASTTVTVSPDTSDPAGP